MSSNRRQACNSTIVFQTVTPFCCTKLQQHTMRKKEKKQGLNYNHDTHTHNNIIIIITYIFLHSTIIENNKFYNTNKQIKCITTAEQKKSNKKNETTN